MSIAMLEHAARALGELRNEVVFVGGATVSLWITDPAAPAPRVTKDVDVVVEVTTRAELHKFEARLRGARFREDTESGVICRWLHGDDEEELILDVMAADASLMGFANRWQAEALPHALVQRLPSGVDIRAVPPAFLIATKIEAFGGRGGGDHLGSRDLEDIVLLVDGRDSIVDEVKRSTRQLQSYLTEELGRLLAEPRFEDAIFGFLRSDMASQARAERVVLPRLREMARIQAPP
jgi:hypothetical protein